MLNTLRSRHHWSVSTASALALILGLMTAACEDDNEVIPIIVNPPLVTRVATFVDPTFDFTTLTTFAMPDTVIHFAPLTGTPLAVTREFDQLILNQVRLNLLNRGYVPAADPQTTAPSFVVLVGATATENAVAWVGYPWFAYYGFYSGLNWYQPGFDNSWTIIYPWYPVAGVTTYARGTLLVDLIPTATVNPLSKSIRSAWAGAATGALDGTNTASDIQSAINEMFIQSPYLHAPQVNPLRPD